LIERSDKTLAGLNLYPSFSHLTYISFEIFALNSENTQQAGNQGLFKITSVYRCQLYNAATPRFAFHRPRKAPPAVETKLKSSATLRMVERAVTVSPPPATDSNEPSWSKHTKAQLSPYQKAGFKRAHGVVPDQSL
jgi:hypothetical protein